MQLAVYRSLRPAERVAIAVALSEDARAVALAGIARRHPHLGPADTIGELLRVLRREAARSEPQL